MREKEEYSEHQSRGGEREKNAMGEFAWVNCVYGSSKMIKDKKD